MKIDLQAAIDKVIKSKNLNKKELAPKTGISYSFLNDITIRTKIPSPKVFLSLLENIQVSLSEFELLITEYYKVNPMKIDTVENMICKNLYFIKLLFQDIPFSVDTMLLVKHPAHKKIHIKASSIDDLIETLSKNNLHELLYSLAKNLLTTLSNIATGLFKDDYKGYNLKPSLFKLLRKLAENNNELLKIISKDYEIEISNFSNMIQPDFNIETLRKNILSNQEQLKQLHDFVEYFCNFGFDDRQDDNISNLKSILDSIYYFMIVSKEEQGINSQKDIRLSAERAYKQGYDEGYNKGLQEGLNKANKK